MQGYEISGGVRNYNGDGGGGGGGVKQKISSVEGLTINLMEIVRYHLILSLLTLLSYI